MADINKLLEVLENQIKPLTHEEFIKLLAENIERKIKKLVSSEKYKRATSEEKFRLLVEADKEADTETWNHIKRLRQNLPAVYKESPKLAELKQAIFKSGRRSPKHYLGETEESYRWEIYTGEAQFRKEGQRFFQSRREAEILLPQPPKLETQLKNLWAIGLLLQKVNEPRFKKGEPPVFEVDFSLAEYARIRGYTDEEIKKSGKFYEELKKDLITGAKTTYTLKDVVIDGKKYTLYGVPNFYMLAEPAEKKGKWKIIINEFYGGDFLPGGQYYGIPAEVIADRESTHTENLFVLLLKRYEGGSEWTSSVGPLSVSKVIDSITDSQRARDEQAETYKVLAKCLIYAWKKDLLEAVRFYTPNLKRTKAVEDISLFELWSYEDFKAEVLRPLKLDDIRESRIKFYSDRRRITETEIELKPEEIISEGPALPPAGEAGKGGK